MSDRDDALELQRLRAAEAALDQRPSPRVRHAVLRAAADACKQRAGGPAPSVKPRLALRWGWSLPVAASVLIGAIALGLISEIERAPAPLEPERAAPAASREPAAQARSEAQSPAPLAPAAPAPAALSQAPAAPATHQAGDAIERRRAAPRLTAAPSAKATTQASESSAARSAAAAAPQAAAGAAGAGPANAAVSLKLAQETPQQWIDRIVAMRRQGRQDEADRELERLRKRFPDVVVPPAALR